VLLDENGDLYWVTEVDGKEVHYDEEPETTFGQRFMSGFIMILPVEHQLQTDVPGIRQGTGSRWFSRYRI
jgi:hypothetical protein